MCRSCGFGLGSEWGLVAVGAAVSQVGERCLAAVDPQHGLGDGSAGSGADHGAAPAEGGRHERRVDRLVYHVALLIASAGLAGVVRQGDAAAFLQERLEVDPVRFAGQAAQRAGVDDSFCATLDAAGNALLCTGSPGTSPGGYQIGGLGSLWPATHWQAGATVTISPTLSGPNGSPMPGSFAASIASHCEFQLSAAGAQHLGRACARYNASSGDFTFRWHLSPRAHATERLEFQLTYPAPATAWARVTITAATHHHQPHHGRN